MSKKIKAIIFTSIGAVVIIVVAFVVFLNVPTTVLKYKSNDENIVVSIIESKDFDFAPSRSQDYTLLVKQKKSIGSKVLLKRDFTFYADCSAISEVFVDVELKDNKVVITIDSDEMNAKTFEATW